MVKPGAGSPHNTVHNMESKRIKDFRSYRSRMNKRILAQDNKLMRRIYNLDTNAYLEGALPAKTKEMLGLVSFIVIPHTRRALEYWEELES